jgi:hypothetical protein
LTLADNYWKTTCLWASDDFEMPEPQAHPQVQSTVDMVKAVCGRATKKRALEVFATREPSELKLVQDWYPDDRIHTAPPGEDRANFRSATPPGFSMATFLANAPHLKAAANDNKPNSERAAA